MDCALFDFSFLECVRLDGKRARDVIEAFTGRSLEALAEREICYALRIGPAGEAIADLTVWRTGPDSFEVMSGRREDVADLLACAGPGLWRHQHDGGQGHLRGAGARDPRSIAPAWGYRSDRLAQIFQFRPRQSRRRFLRQRPPRLYRRGRVRNHRRARPCVRPLERTIGACVPRRLCRRRHASRRGGVHPVHQRVTAAGLAPRSARRKIRSGHRYAKA